MKLSHKISGLLIVTCVICLCIAQTISVIFVIPKLQAETMKSANSNMKLLALQTKAKMDLIESYAASMSDSYDLKAALHILQEDPTEDHYANVVYELDNKKSQMTGTLVLAVQPQGGGLITSTKGPTAQESEFFETSEYQYFQNLDYAKQFFFVYKVPYSMDHAWGNPPDDRYAATYCMNFYVDAQRYTISVFAEINEIIEATESLTKNVMDAYAWLDSTQQPFWEKGEVDVVSMAEKRLEDRLYYSYEFFKEGQDGYLFLHTMPQSKWTLCAYMSNKSLLQGYGGIFMASTGVVFLLVMAIIFIILPRINRYIRPLRQLSETMRRVGGGDLTVVSDIETNDEFQDLSNGFNRMIQDLNRYIGRVIEKEKAEQKMRYSLLISQIDPHFIYNTMNTINYLARMGRDQDIIQVNSALIHILQDRLRINLIDIFDSVSQELDMIHQYMTIQQYRYANQVHLIVDVEAEMLERRIPKNVLQPLVENALFHGMTNEDGEPIEGVITIRISDYGDDIMIQVLDTGCGISEERLAQLNDWNYAESVGDRGRHIGIQNIKNRLFSLYGRKDCFSISSQPDGGTCVTLIVSEMPL